VLQAGAGPARPLAHDWRFAKRLAHKKSFPINDLATLLAQACTLACTIGETVLGVMVLGESNQRQIGRASNKAQKSL
jgi:hypothetical protein